MAEANEQEVCGEKIKTVNRYRTFFYGLCFTLMVYTILYLLLQRYIPLNWGMSLGLFVIVFVCCFILGLVKVAGKDDKGEDIEAGFVGVVQIFDAPLPRRLQFLLPSGDSWLLPLIMEVKPIDKREQAYDMPRDEKDDGFEVVCISTSGRGKSKAVKYVPMKVKARIRFRVNDPNKWYAQDSKVIEKTLVTKVSETMREIATNGIYPSETHQIKIRDDFDLMAKRNELGRALTEDLKQLAADKWGLEVINVIIRHLMPSDPTLAKIYLGVAQEIAQKQSQRIELAHIFEMAKTLKGKEGVSADEALLYAMLEAGKITVEAFKGLGGRPFFVKNDATSRPSSPST